MVEFRNSMKLGLRIVVSISVPCIKVVCLLLKGFILSVALLFLALALLLDCMRLPQLVYSDAVAAIFSRMYDLMIWLYGTHV